MVLWEMMAGDLPWHGVEGHEDLKARLLRGERPSALTEREGGFPAAYRALVRAGLEFEVGRLLPPHTQTP